MKTYLSSVLPLKCSLLIAGLLWLSVSIAAPPVVTLVPSRTTGVVPFQFTLTYTVSGAASCTASGGWSGAKSVTGGVETLPKNTASVSVYTLTCATNPGGTGEAILSWTPPTLNTDGSAYTDQQGFIISHGPTATPGGAGWTELPTTIGPTVSTYTITGLTLGVRYFSVQAINTANVRSAYSNVPSKTITGAAAETTTVSASVTGTTAPQPPGTVTVAAVEGSNVSPVFKLTATNKRSPEVAGFAPLDVVCVGNVLFYYRDGAYRQVPIDVVKWWGVVPGTKAAALCG